MNLGHKVPRKENYRVVLQGFFLNRNRGSLSFSRNWLDSPKSQPELHRPHRSLPLGERGGFTIGRQ